MNKVDYHKIFSQSKPYINVYFFLLGEASVDELRNVITLLDFPCNGYLWMCTNYTNKTQLQDKHWQPKVHIVMIKMKISQHTILLIKLLSNTKFLLEI